MQPDTTLRYCPMGGLLVGAEDWLPDIPYEHNWGTFDPHIGCNRLACSACGREVRHELGLVIEDEPSVNPGELYAARDWSDVRFIREDLEGKGRLYACACRFRLQFGSIELDPPIDEAEREFVSGWRCAGHPRFKVPGELFGIQFDSDTDIDAVVQAALAGTLAPQPPRLAKIPGYWAVRLYVLLRDAGLGDEVGRAVAGDLTSPEPQRRRAALEFFYEFPSAPGAEALAAVTLEHRDFFRGHADPQNPRRELDAHLLKALERRILNAEDAAAIDAARREILGGTRRPSLIQALAARDQGWVRDHAGEIAQANPGALNKVVYALCKLADDDVVAAVKAAHDKNLVSKEDLRLAVDEALRFDPDRRAEITRRALGGEE